jgi:hypothetical protein
VADAGQPWLIPSLCLIVGLLGMAVLLRLTGLWPF